MKSLLLLPTLLVTAALAAASATAAPGSSAASSAHLCASNGRCATVSLSLRAVAQTSAQLLVISPFNISAELSFDPQPAPASAADDQAMLQAAHQLLAPLVAHIDGFRHALPALSLGQPDLDPSSSSSSYSYSLGGSLFNYTLPTTQTSPLLPRLSWPVAPGSHQFWVSAGTATSNRVTIFQSYPAATLRLTRLDATHARLTIHTPFLKTHNALPVILSASYQRPDGHFGPKPLYSDFVQRVSLSSHGASSVSVVVPLQAARWRIGLAWADSSLIAPSLITWNG